MSLWKIPSEFSCQKLHRWWNYIMCERFLCGPLLKLPYVFGADPKSKMASTAGQSLTLDLMGNTFKDLLVRNYTTEEIILWRERSLCGPLPKLCFWCRSEVQDGCHRGTKINIGTLWEIPSKILFSETTMSVKMILCRNVPWMVCYRVYVFVLPATKVAGGKT